MLEMWMIVTVFVVRRDKRLNIFFSSQINKNRSLVGEAGVGLTGNLGRYRASGRAVPREPPLP